jgi:hypothetical protein
MKTISQSEIISREYRLVGGSAPRGCTEDGGRPLGVGLQEQASKHLKLMWSKAMVVSVKEKVPPQTGSVVNQRDERKRTIR